MTGNKNSKFTLKGGRRIVALVFAGLVIAELATRISGIVDFPVYQRSGEIGYFLTASQHGKFLGRNRWFVNADGFNNDQPFTATHPYTVLVGDSVVYGGNPVDYADRIGTISSELAQQNVWTAALGGWSLYNELAYISARKQIISQADHLVFVFDNGDLEGLASWGGEFIHPTAHPMLAFPYALKRYLIPRLFNLNSTPELPAIPQPVSHNKSLDWQRQLDDLLAYYPGKIMFVLYPDQETCARTNLWQDQTREIRQYIARHQDRIFILDVQQIKGWDAGDYRDGIHPNSKGDQLLAVNISAWISKP